MTVDGTNAQESSRPPAIAPLPRGGLEEIWDDPQFRMASYFSASLEMIGGLPNRWATVRDGLVRNACLEAFFVHVRLLSEFLVRRPPEKDFSARDFLWPAPTSEAAMRLGGKWFQEPSQHVVHFSRRRVPDQRADIQIIEDIEAYMREAADDVFAVAEEFVTALERASHRYAETLRLDLDRSRRLLASTSRDTSTHVEPSEQDQHSSSAASAGGRLAD